MPHAWCTVGTQVLNGGATSVMMNCFAFLSTDKDKGPENITSLMISVLPKP